MSEFWQGFLWGAGLVVFICVAIVLCLPSGEMDG